MKERKWSVPLVWIGVKSDPLFGLRVSIRESVSRLKVMLRQSRENKWKMCVEGLIAFVKGYPDPTLKKMKCPCDMTDDG